MKTKTKTTPRAKTRQKSAFSKKKVDQAYAKFPGLRHLRLIEHKHTFKLIHHRHTSHLVLFVILIIVGFFLYASSGMVQAETSSGSVLIGTIVPGPPPNIGATITSPKDGLKLKDTYTTEISGTCSEDSFVVVSDDGLAVGSATCSGASIFSLRIQLEAGKNTLSALNYDNLNQPGPVTPSVTVFVIKSASTNNTTELMTINGKTVASFTPLVPINPSIIRGIPSTFSSCSDYKPGTLPVGGELHIAVACITRLLFPDMQEYMGVLVWGGTPPYALSIDYGDSSTVNPTLLSLVSPNYNLIKFSFAMPNTYTIKFYVTDQKKQTAIVQTSVQVNGEKQSSLSSTISNITNNILGGKPWYESPVPFYLLAIAITLGFWGGDIFDRKYGAGHRHTKRKRIAI